MWDLDCVQQTSTRQPAQSYPPELPPQTSPHQMARQKSWQGGHRKGGHPQRWHPPTESPDQMGRPCRQNTWLPTTKAGIVWRTLSNRVVFWGRRNVSKTCIKDGHKGYLRHGYLQLSKDKQQVQWPDNNSHDADLIQVSVSLYRLNYTDVTALL